jgi:hypothetical protein
MNARTIRKITTNEMRCVRRMTDISLRYRIRKEDLRNQLGTETANKHNESSIRKMKILDKQSNQENYVLVEYLRLLEIL